MDLKQVRYFVQVAELGSFAKASEVLDVAQPTLSRQVRALELVLQTSLLHRNGRGVELTSAGARFLEQAHGVLHAADAAMQVLQGDERRFTGHVACGMTPSVGRKLVSEYVRRFRKELPNTTLAISSHLSIALQEQLRAARLDFAIVHDPVASPALDITLLRRQPLYVLGMRTLGENPKAISISALNKLPLLLPSRLYAVRKVIELAAARSGVVLDIRSEVDVLDALFELVAEGVGHTVATETAIAGLNQRSGLSVQRIISPDIQIELALVTPFQRSLTPLQRKAAELAKELFGTVASLRDTGIEI
jgi:LysR family nitrogen assimilation transcriptional regulator